MSNSQNNPQQVIEHFFRQEWSRVVSTLTIKFGSQNLTIVEDAVQEALEKAMRAWGYGKVPENPGGWIYNAAKNRVIDVLRKAHNFTEKTPSVVHFYGSSDTHSKPEVFFDTEIKDEQLRMIFALCDPVLSDEQQLMLTLKILCGLGVREIASALLKKNETVAKALTRAKVKFQSEVKSLEIPEGVELENRLDNVMRVLYLLFNEGYSVTEGEELINLDLMTEAMRLGQMLVSHKNTASAEVHSLMALMYFQASRFDARHDSDGNLLTLEHQDRTKWDDKLISIGFQYLAAADGMRQAPGYYFIQAAIASVHCEVSDYALTNWSKLLNFYNHLQASFPTPMGALNRIVAFQMVHGDKAALKELKGLENESAVTSHYLYFAIRGNLLEKLGDLEKAKKSYALALENTSNSSQRRFFKDKLLKI